MELNKISVSEVLDKLHRLFHSKQTTIEIKGTNILVDNKIHIITLTEDSFMLFINNEPLKNFSHKDVKEVKEFVLKEIKRREEDFNEYKKQQNIIDKIRDYLSS